MNWDDAKPKLQQKLDPKYVKKPQGNFGPKGDYIEGWHAIAEANECFGFDGWSYTITDMRQDSLTQAKNGKGEDQWQAAYTCIVRVTVGDVVREDVGFGSGFAKQIGDAIEGATKESVTDALKRALRTFGNRFGLALYDESREGVGKPEATPEAKRDWVKAKINNAADASALDAWWKKPDISDLFGSLPAPMQGELQKLFTDKLASISQAPPNEEQYQ